MTDMEVEGVQQKMKMMTRQKDLLSDLELERAPIAEEGAMSSKNLFLKM